MIDENFARLRTHRNNMGRYRQLLKTELTELERQFIERRLLEEQAMLEFLSASVFPLYPQNQENALTGGDDVGGKSRKE